LFTSVKASKFGLLRSSLDKSRCFGYGRVDDSIRPAEAE
jgi:hypothetical protein